MGMVRADVERGHRRSTRLDEHLAQMGVHPAELRFIDQPSGEYRLIRDDDTKIAVLVNRLKRFNDARKNSDLICVRQQVDILYENAVAIEEESAFALHTLFGFSHLWK